MPNKDRNIPKRRFKEFENEDAWELRKFDKITFLAGQKNKNNLPYESYSVTNDKGFVPQNEQFEKGGTMATADKSMYYIVSPSSFAYNPARINIGSIGYYNQPENVIVSSLYEVFKTTDEVYDRFLWHWFKSDIFKKKIEELQEGGVRLYFYYDKLCKCSLFLPSIQEQKIIGDRLDSLDRQITLHQRKLDKLKHVKQAYLSEMFPAEGERVPKRRFPGFTDDWELRKLGELIDNLKGGVSITPNDYIENGYRTIPKGAVNDTGIADLSSCKNVSVDFFEKNYFSKTITGELITSLRDLVPSAPNLGRIVRIVGQFEEFIMPQGVYSLKTGENLLEDFLIAYSNCYIYRNVIQSEKNGSTQVHIRNGEFLNIKIQLPTLPEQKAIGTFFSTLDQQITLHQRKLEKLKNLKKALLNELFV
ncbi:TPA: restriction endonuclease subunit S [Streptococcus suis]